MRYMNQQKIYIILCFQLFVDVAPVLRVFPPPVDYLHCHDNNEFIFFF